MASGSESNPKDLQVMKDILEHAGITEYETSVLNQMLEFTYRYVTGIIEDAVLYSSYAHKNAVDTDDVILTIYLQQEKTFANVPSRELTAEVARYRNATPLPTIRTSAGLRLPAERHSVTGCNFNLKSQAKKARTTSNAVSRTNVPSIVPSSMSIPRPTTIVQKPGISSIIKISEGNKLQTIHSQVPGLSAMPPTAQMATINSLPSSLPNIMPTEVRPSNGENKRVHEDDDYEN